MGASLDAPHLVAPLGSHDGIGASHFAPLGAHCGMGASLDASPTPSPLGAHAPGATTIGMSCLLNEQCLLLLLLLMCFSCSSCSYFSSHSSCDVAL